MKDLESRFYETLFSGRASSVFDALELLNKLNPCEKSTDDRALIDDLLGEASNLAYKASGDKSYFEAAQTAYEKAAALNTARNEKIYWHMARLMRSAKRYPEAIQYLNKVLEMRPEPKDPLPYLETAFQLTVDTDQWKDAKGLLGELLKRNKQFYADPELLLSSVITLCHFEEYDNAKTIIKNVENYVELDESGKKLVQQSKDTVKNCEEKTKH